MNADWCPQRSSLLATFSGHTASDEFVVYFIVWLWSRGFSLLNGLSLTLPISVGHSESVKFPKGFLDQVIHHIACGLTLPPVRVPWLSIQSVIHTHMTAYLDVVSSSELLGKGSFSLPSSPFPQKCSPSVKLKWKIGMRQKETYIGKYFETI